MRSLDKGKAAALFVFVVLTIFLFAGSSDAQQTPVAGKITAKYTVMDSLVVSASDGHLLTLGQSEGSNANLGKTPFFDGAVVINLSYSDLVKGNGLHQGYIRFMKAGDGVTAKWNGKVTTVMTPEGAPNTTFEGVFIYVNGNGMFAGIKGQGTFRGAFTSKIDYTVEWQGEYTLGK